MQQDPFAHLNFKQIQAAERKYRARHPLLWRVAESVVFIRNPMKAIRSRRRSQKIGYDSD